ncbi:MAG: 4-hydroxybenzoate octaprenyltransferase, partial [Candidatus Regiella insecticola]|nr:4-hydroxybenzoate octaprenyltransferase [Candidatus Regiella insecticola]
FYYSILIAGVLFIYKQKIISNREPNGCFRAFLKNKYVGLILFLGIFFSYI